MNRDNWSLIAMCTVLAACGAGWLSAAIGAFNSSQITQASAAGISFELPDGDSCSDIDVGDPWQASLTSVGAETSYSYAAHGTIPVN